MTQTDPNAPRSADIIEELQIAGEQLLGKVKELVREGSVRRIRVKQDGHVILEIPLAIGFVGVILAPTMAAIGAMGALIAQCSIEVVRGDGPAWGTPTPVKEESPVTPITPITPITPDTPETNL